MRVRASAAATASLLAATLAVLTGCTSGSGDPAPTRVRAAIVASTTWVGALARAAGATDVTVIAPATVPDQSAFDPTPEELAPARGAKHVLYAETDGFAAALKSAAGGARLVSVRAVTSPPAAPSPPAGERPGGASADALSAIRSEVTRLGAVFGTEQAAGRWVRAFDAQTRTLSESLSGLAPIPPATAVAHVDVAHWAAFAGVRVVGSYGPGPVSAEQRDRLAALRPKLLLTSVHAPAQTPQLPGSIRVDLVNYPGADLDLIAVFRTNADRIGATFSK